MNFLYYVVGFSMLCVLFTPAVSALPVVKPMPQEISWTSDDEAWLAVDALRGVALPDADAQVSAALERLANALDAPLPVTPTGNLRLELDSLPPSVSERTRHEAYHLAADADGIVITAATSHGLHNGLITLTALADKEKGIPCVTITDWPDQMMRATYSGNLNEAEELFDWFVELILNMLVLEDGRLYDLDNPEVHARIQRLAQRCRDNHIEFVPELQSLGWGHFVLDREPRAVEAEWIERAAFPVRDGRVYAPDPPMPARAVVENADFEAGLDGWRADTYYGQWDASSAEEAGVTVLDGNPVLRLALSQVGSVRVSQKISVQPDARYTLRASVKTEDVQSLGGGAYIEVYGIDANGVWTEMLGPRSAPSLDTGDWTTIQTTFFSGGYQRPRPGGAIEDDLPRRPEEGYEEVQVFLRLENATGTAWFDAIEIEPDQSPNPLANAVVTEAARVIVESEDGAVRYEEDRDYTLVVPELRYPTGLGAPLEVILTNNSRIENGDTILLSFNQAQYEVITNCPSEPLYYDFMRKSIRNVVEKLNPSYLHIGHDEPQFFNRCQRCRDRNMANEDLFVYAIKRLHRYAREANPDIRIMLWDDAINPYQNARYLGAETAAEKLPRDLIVCVWWYDNNQWEEQIDKSVEFFMNLGFEVTGVPWFRKPNAYRWAEVLEELKDDPKALGIIYTSWGGVSQPWGALELTAEHSWSFGKPAPDFNE